MKYSFTMLELPMTSQVDDSRGQEWLVLVNRISLDKTLLIIFGCPLYTCRMGEDEDAEKADIGDLEEIVVAN